MPILLSFALSSSFSVKYGVCNLISPKKERQKEREGTALINVLKSKHQTDILIILVIRMTKRTSHTHNVLVTQDTRRDGVKVKVKVKVIH